MLEQAPGRTCDPVNKGVHAVAGLLAVLVTPWRGGPMLKKPVPEGLRPVERVHGKDPRWSSL